MVTRERRATPKELRKTVNALSRRLIKEEIRKAELHVLEEVINRLAVRRDELTKK
jgi:hypothetical protein